MRIATWNVNGVRARMEFIAHWLERRAPDVVGLQELKVSDADFPHEEFATLGYQAVAHGEKAWNGVAVLSREPAEADVRGLPDREDNGARLLRVRVAGLDFATVYCPNGKTLEHPDYRMKLAWFDALRDYLSGIDPESAFVIGGDYNIVPTALDCWQGEAADGSIFCTGEERARYRSLIDLGLTDLFRHLHPDEQKFSWWDYRGGSFYRGMGLRIDMLLGTAAVASRVRRVEIDREYRKKKDGLTASDHAPVFADLD
ncbi:MAG: exodeoxyribonuclease III [Rhodospirillales bacterium]|nr:exodeoxyribonuclease III [Rhodospirillales bacterium]